MFLPLGLFAVAAIGGLIMAAHLLGDRSPPKILPFLHGGFAVAGVVALYLAVRSGAPQYATLALGIFAAAAVGGLYLASFHFRGRFPPKLVIVLHALLAVSGFGLLAATAFNMI